MCQTNPPFYNVEDDVSSTQLLVYSCSQPGRYLGSRFLTTLLSSGGAVAPKPAAAKKAKLKQMAVDQYLHSMTTSHTQTFLPPGQKEIKDTDHVKLASEAIADFDRLWNFLTGE